MEAGYLYIATGERHVKEALRSAESLRRVHPKAHATLIIDRPLESNLFNQIIVRPYRALNPWEGFLYKVKHMYSDSPYLKTLFLDTDTFFYENAASLFRLLDFFDLCLSLAPNEQVEGSFQAHVLKGYIPYNSGVIFFRKNLENENLFLNWHKIYEEKLKRNSLRPEEGDQTSLMEALLTTKSRVYILPNIWNARIFYYLNLRGKVKIVHGRCRDYRGLERRINITDAQRAWDPVKEKCLFREEKNGRLTALIRRLCAM